MFKNVKFKILISDTKHIHMHLIMHEHVHNVHTVHGELSFCPFSVS